MYTYNLPLPSTETFHWNVARFHCETMKLWHQTGLVRLAAYLKICFQRLYFNCVLLMTSELTESFSAQAHAARHFSMVVEV